MLTAVAADVSSARPIVATRATNAFSRFPIPATRAFASSRNSWIPTQPNTAKISDRVLKTGLGDSGSGGLFFGIDMTRVGILATRATTLSQRYHVVLADLHKQEYGNNALTVVINNDPFVKDKLTSDHSFQFTRVFRGDRPLERGSNEEREAFRRIRENLVTTPVQFLHVHAPKNWVSIIECKGAAAEMTPAARHELLTQEVEKEIENFVTYAHAFYRGYTDSPLQGLSVVGLCCTHYPYVQQQIKDELLKHNVKGATVVSQGAAFGKYIFQPTIEKWLVAKEIPLRQNPIPIQLVPPPKITSYTTVNPANPHDMESARELPKLAALIDSSIASRIHYKTIPPITLTKSDQ